MISEYENRRYNKNETSKQFYLRRKKDMEDYFANPYYKIYEKKMWDEYKKINMKEKQDKPMMAKLVKVLEDKPKGITVAELQMTGEVRIESNQIFEIPQGPARIGSQWW